MSVGFFSSAPIHIVGSAGDDVLTLTASVGGDDWTGTVDGGAGTDTLRLVSDSYSGYFDLTKLSVLSGIEIIRSASEFTTIWIRDDQLLGVATINGGDGVMGENILGLEGTELDLRPRTILNFDRISVVTDRAVVTLADKELALKVTAYGAQGDHLILEGHDLSEAERDLLHRRGVDKITDGSGVVSINEAPVVSNLNGDALRTIAGRSVLLDVGSNGGISDDDGAIFSLSFSFATSVLTTESIEIDTTGSVQLSDGLFNNSVISVGGTAIGVINQVTSHGFSVRMTSGATPDLVNQLVQSVTYVNRSSDPNFAAHRKILITANDLGGREGTAVISVTVAQPGTMVLTADVDTIVGTGADEYLVAEKNTLNAGDILNGGAGFDTLRFSSPREAWDIGDYDLTVLGDIRNIEKLEGSDAEDTFHLDADALTSFSVLDGKGPKFAGDELILHGHALDLRGKRIENFETIDFGNDNVSLTIDNSSLADLISAQTRDGIHVTLEGGAFSMAQLSRLFASGVDLVTDSKGTYTSYPFEPFPPPPPVGGTWTGTNGNDTYTGTFVAEVFKGLGGKDYIDGGAGDDTIWGGASNDTLKGNTGRDIFVFDTKPHKSSNKDKIVDFSVKDDTIWLDNKIFTKLGKAGSESKPAQLKKDYFVVGSKAKDKNDYIVYDKAKGVLYYDADGSGNGKAVEIATLSKKLAPTYKDFFII